MKQPEFGKQLAKRRIELGLTQEDLADKCRITVRSIQRIEAGTVNPRYDTLRMLDSVLDFEKGIFLKERVEDLKEFYEHAALYLIINLFIYLKEIFVDSEGFELHSITIIWGLFVALHAAEVVFDRFFGAAWERKKITKWMSTKNVFGFIRNKIFSRRLYSRTYFKIGALFFLAVSAIWFLFIGYHHHKVTITRGAISINIKSAHSHFEFSLPEQRTDAMNEYAINGYRMTSEKGIPFHIHGHGIITSKQMIRLPDSTVEYQFSVNDLDFVLKENNLYQGKHSWYLKPNEPLKINADKLE